MNVVLITLDTVRADHLRCYGNRNIQTPVIDGLARSGVLFDRAVAQAPLTAPSHASMLTGTNPNVHGVRDNGFALRPSSITMATILRNHGWDTAGFISAPVLQKTFGFGQGFTTYDDQLWQHTDPSTNLPATSRPANITVDHAIDWLQSQGRMQPFFLWIHLYDAHQPYNPPAEFRKQYPRDPYDAEIAFEDQQLGRFLKRLYRQSPANKTLVVLLSDHGEGLGQHGEDSHGVFLYDSTVRIAWIMTGPGIPAALRVQQQAREIDVLPTVLNLLGIQPPSAAQGTTMLPAFFGNSVPSTYSYEETLYPEIDMGWSKLLGIHTAHWMYVQAPTPELYDLDRDPGELHNVIKTHPKKYRVLDEQLKRVESSGNNGTETSAISDVDLHTAQQLTSLGYIAPFAGIRSPWPTHAADPKDRLESLQLISRIGDPDWVKLSSATQAKLLLQTLQKDPTNPFLYCTLGELYTKTGQYYAAQQTYATALHMGIRSAILFSLLGDLYLHLGYTQQAIVFFSKAVQLNPRDVENQSNLGTALLQAHQLTDAERQFNAALAIQPYAPAYNGLAIIAVYRHDDPGARQNFVHAIQLNPAYVTAQSNLGFLCLRTHDLPCARSAFQAVIDKAGPADRNLVPSAKIALANLPQP